MKKLFLLFVIALFVGNINAQKLIEGTVSVLKDKKNLNMEVDFSKAKFWNRMTIDDFLYMKTEEEDEGEAWKDYWNKDCVKSFIKKFSKSANENLFGENFRIGTYPDSKYTAVFFVSSVDEDGEISGIIVIKEQYTNKTVAVISKIHGEGGHYGSIENLIGDGMERAGKQFGRFLTKNW